MQLETALCNQYCFCNTELRTATVTKIKGLLIQTQLHTFVLFTLLTLTLDEHRTLTKILTCNLSQQFPQTSARFGHDKIRNKKTSKQQKTGKQLHANYSAYVSLGQNTEYQPFIKNASGEDMGALGQVTCTFTINNQPFTQSFIVCRHMQ